MAKAKTEDLCEVCGISKHLTRSAALHALMVSTARGRVYTHYLCDDCVMLFAPSRWVRTRRALVDALNKHHLAKLTKRLKGI